MITHSPPLSSAWFRCLLLGAACLGGLALPAITATAVQAEAAAVEVRNQPEAGLIRVPDQALPIMPVDEVRVGMRGYGLTVFQGTKIEPFAVEVLSVSSTEGPNRPVIWVICDDDRMRVSGPVQGMSGSPIFLWNEGEQGTPGEGGRLIGAFAFGYGGVLQPLAGVQPVELMRDVAQRIDVDGQRIQPVHGPASPRQAALGVQMLDNMYTIASEDEQFGLFAQRIAAMRKMLRPTQPQPREPLRLDTPTDEPGQIRPLLLPMSVGSAELARFMRPLLEPMGVLPMAGDDGLLSGKAPSNVDPTQVFIEPGSVLSIPFATGDLDLAAAGTVTEVLPDGRVLAFGHAMNAIGDTSVPMATGYVHFVVPLRSISFKRSGSLQVAGSVIRDEQSAVGGVGDLRFSTAPVEVKIDIEGQPTRTYQYQVLDDTPMTPMIAAVVVARSIMAVQDLPPENTLRITGEIGFSTGQRVKVDDIVPSASAQGVVMALAPVINTFINNPFEKTRLESVTVHAEVTPTIDSVQFSEVWLERTLVAPGEAVAVNIEFMQHRGEKITRRLVFDIPADVPEGDYVLAVGNAQTYLSRVMSTHPHYTRVRNLDELAAALERIGRYRNDALYALLLVPRETGVAVGREELPQLPSSRMAMFAGQVGTRVTPYIDMLEKIEPLGQVVASQTEFRINVRHPHPTSPRSDQ